MAELPIRVLGERVLVKPMEAETTSGGIHLPQSAQERPQRGEVVAVGAGKAADDDDEATPIEVEVGDVVIFAKHSGTELTIDGEDYLVLDADRIYAKET
jgi:chaperonin GroES